MDHHSIAQFRTAGEFVAGRFAVDQFAVDLSLRRTASANESPRRAANLTGDALLIDDLKTRRQGLGWSVREVGERCGIDEKSLNAWEHGIASPRLDAVQHWAAVLGLNFTLVPAENQALRGLKVDWGKRCITVDGTPVRLTPMEWKALERLAWAPGELVTHQAMFDHLYGNDRHYRAESTAVRVLITKLRRLLPLRIDARWGKGYVISGVEPSLLRAPSVGDGVGDGSATSEPIAATAQRAHVVPLPNPAPRDPPPPIRGELVDRSEPLMPRVAAPASRPGPGRAEELGVIERFLAERGVNRCPDVATMQQSPLPTLIWDKIKRKWVRPSLTGCAAK